MLVHHGELTDSELMRRDVIGVPDTKQLRCSARHLARLEEIPRPTLAVHGRRSEHQAVSLHVPVDDIDEIVVHKLAVVESVDLEIDEEVRSRGDLHQRSDVGLLELEHEHVRPCNAGHVQVGRELTAGETVKGLTSGRRTGVGMITIVNLVFFLPLVDEDAGAGPEFKMRKLVPAEDGPPSLRE